MIENCGKDIHFVRNKSIKSTKVMTFLQNNLQFN